MTVEHRAAADVELASSTEPSAPREADEVVSPREPTVTEPVLVSEVSTAPPPTVTLDKPTFVQLELTIDEHGSVAEARIVGGDVSLGAHAQERARAFRFTPALVDDEPTSVIIEYRFWFVPEPTAEAEALPPAPVAAPDMAQPQAPAASPAASPAVANVSLDEEVYEGTAEVEAPARETTRRSLDQERLLKLPGTRGDALLAIESLPGVARAPQGSNPIIRGSSWAESTTLIDGVEVPLLYHFGGLTSTVPSRLLESVDLYPGNFAPRYGRASGGVIEARFRQPRQDRLAAVLDLNFVDSSLLVESPVGEKVAFAAAVRRSNIDFVFESLVPDDAFTVVAAPVYWDYQNLWSFQLGTAGRLSVNAYGSRDQLRLVFDQPSRVDPNLSGELSGALEYHRVRVAHEVSLGSVRQSLALTAGKDLLRQSMGVSTRAELNAWTLDARGQWDTPLTEAIDVALGFDVSARHFSGGFYGYAASAAEGEALIPESARAELRINETAFVHVAPALWLQAAVHPTPEWTLLPGFRADYYHHLAAMTFNPRLSQRYELNESTAIKSGVGWYSQNPQYYESLEQVGNPDINPYHALHTSAGVELRPMDGVLLDVEGFYKYQYERIVATEGGVPPTFINDGVGRIYGAELGLTMSPTPVSHLQLSYTLSRSERRDRNDAWRLFDQDQTHILSLAASHALGSGWEVGARFRYITGNPYTPVVRGVYDAAQDAYVPVSGSINSERDADFHQLDLRVEKQFSLDPLLLAIYLDIQNVYNRQNPEGYGYSYDYEVREQLSALPFFPNLGLRGEL